MAAVNRGGIPCWLAENVVFKDKLFSYLTDLGQLPWMFIQSPTFNLYGGAGSAIGHTIIPFRYKIIAAWNYVIVTPGTAGAAWKAGTLADSGNDNVVATTAIALGAAVGFVDKTADLVSNPFEGAAGDVIVFTSLGGATSTGSALAGLLAVRSPS